MSTEMTRRSLIKGAGVAGAGLIAASGMASVALADEPTDQPAPDDASTETAAEGSAYSGFTTEKPSFMTPPDPIPADQIVNTLECEVLVVGGGLAGCAAAASAAENGVDVILCEKTSTIQMRGAGIGTVNTDLSMSFEDGAVTDIPAAAFRWEQTCGNRPNEALIAQFLYRSGEAGNWVVNAGAKHNCIMGIWDGYSRNPLLPDEPGYILMMAGEDSDLTQPDALMVAADVLQLEAIGNGAQFMFDSPVEQLVQADDGRVTGAIANTPDGYVQINASKGIVFATGDIGANTEMCEYYCPEALKIPSVYTPVGANNGDGHRMILWAGGAMQEAPFPPMLHPQRYAELQGPFLHVNEKGERFFNEGTWVQPRSLQMMQCTADDCAWSIFDANWQADLIDSLPEGGGMFWDYFRFKGMSDYNSVAEYYAAAIEANVGDYYTTADTLEELAEKVGLPVDTFLATVEHYNELCEKGVDEDFCKNPRFLYPISEPPFYAAQAGAVLLAIVGGAVINTDFQCLTPEGEPIEGLYAIGNTSGSIYAIDYPINVPGNSHGRALTQGYLVGRKLAGVE